MLSLQFLFLRLIGDRRAASALEYGLIAAVIGGVIITAATSFGNNLSSAYNTVGTTISSKASGM